MFRFLSSDNLRRQKGQSLVEAAIAIPVITIAIFAIVQLGWTTVAGSMLTAATEAAQYSVSPNEAEETEDLNALLRAKMIERSPLLAFGDLRVTGADATVEETMLKSYELDDDEFASYRITTKGERARRIKVAADVTFEPGKIFPVPGLTDARYERRIDSVRIVDETFELA